MHVFRQDNPRGIALANDKDVLILRSAPDNARQQQCIAEFTRWGTFDDSNYRSVTVHPVLGCLGLVNIENDVFICVVTHTSRAAVVRPKENVERIMGVEFHCLNKATWDNMSQPDEALNDLDDEAAAHVRPSNLEHPCSSLRKLLSGGSFYCSSEFDLTTRLEHRSGTKGFAFDEFDDQFMWNKYMIEELIRFRTHLQEEERGRLDGGRFLVCAIRGFAETISVMIGSTPSAYSLISRLSCRRAGTRFNSRGIDDDGNVSNFVETELVLRTKEWTMSFCQVRGSVPVFWEQEGIQFFGQKIEITRPLEATNAAFIRHFDGLVTQYGPVHIVNLLGSSVGEKMLTDLYRQNMDISEELSSQLRYSEFDYHLEVRVFEHAKKIKPLLYADAEEFGYYCEDNAGGVQSMQSGVFRTNCMDCLDRTNVVQSIVAQILIENNLNARGLSAMSEFWSRNAYLWANNGDALSKIYAGTGALKSSHTRRGKMSLAGAINDLSKSVGRAYINNFQDKGRQQTIDMLLGRLVNQVPVTLYDPINDYVTAALERKSSQFTQRQKISIFAGTYNLNGKEGSQLSKWLLPHGSKPEAEFYVVGLQEVVELTPQQVMSTDPARRKYWESAVAECLKSAGGNYVLLRSGQLVGAVLAIFVRHDVLHMVKNVEGAIKKTGLKGMSGNKGAVAIRLDFAATRICFVTAHLAAGHSNYDERNRDYYTINHGLRFQRGRAINDHDSVIWLGDFNYRISKLTFEAVRDSIQKGDFRTLYENDQLNLQMMSGTVFPYYNEGPITFPPTYKFDNGTREYDTSEKQRIPAWTDRIVYKGANIKQLSYYSADLLFSDHRPVYAEFEAEITIIDENVREALSAELYKQRRERIGDPALGRERIDLDRPRHAPGELPLPSTDKEKWWLRNGQHAKVQIPVPDQSEYKLNPNRPFDPFAKTNELDWVRISSNNSSDGETFKSEGRKPNSGPRNLPPPAIPPRRDGTPASQSNGFPSVPRVSNTEIMETLRQPNDTTQTSNKPALPMRRVKPSPQAQKQSEAPPSSSTDQDPSPKLSMRDRISAFESAPQRAANKPPTLPKREAALQPASKSNDSTKSIMDSDLEPENTSFSNWQPLLEAGKK